MSKEIVNQLHKDGFISADQDHLLTDIYSKKIYSLYYEHKAFLFIGITMLATGLGLWIYENIGSLGHQVILLSIAGLTTACFWYATKKKAGFQAAKVQTPGLFYDNILMLGCLLFLTLEGYIQHQYTIFEVRWDIFALIPTILFFFLAYYHDHQGVLSLAITGLTSWVGINATPKAFLVGELFAELDLVALGISYSVLLMAAAMLLSKIGLKRHFTFNYLNFGCNILCISILRALFTYNSDWLYFLFLLAVCASFFFYARKSGSFVFLLYASGYGYIGLSYLILKNINNPIPVLLYFTISGGLMVYLLFKSRKVFAKSR